MKSVTSGVLLAQLGLQSQPGAWVTCLACRCWPFFETTECLWLAGHVSCVSIPWNSHHSVRMFSIPRPHTPCCSERRSSLAHQSPTKGRGLAAGGHQQPLRCSVVPALSHVWPMKLWSYLSNGKLTSNHKNKVWIRYWGCSAKWSCTSLKKKTRVWIIKLKLLTIVLL